MTHLSHTTGLDPVIAARRKRVNRIVVSLLVMIVLPVCLVYGGDAYIDSTIEKWMEQPTFFVSETTSVSLDKPGDYVIWTTNGSVDDCVITLDGTPIPERDFSDKGVGYTSMGGVYSGYPFHAPQSGDYLITCHSENPHTYGFVSTASPLPQATIAMIGSRLGAVASALTGLVLFIVGLTSNARERKRMRQIALQPMYPVGPPVIYPTAPTMAYLGSSVVMAPLPPTGYPLPPGYPQTPIRPNPPGYPPMPPTQPSPPQYS